MAGTADLVVNGFGTWSTVARVITKGYAIATPTPPADGGLEWSLGNNRLEWLTENNRLEWITEGPD